MLRKGWTQVEVPSGWTQLIRGPRPKSVQWPKAVRMSSAVPAGAPQPQRVPRGRWRQQEDHARKNPETPLKAAKKRVRALEAALAVLMESGEPDSPEIKTLQKSLVVAKRAVLELPVEQLVEKKGKEKVDPTRRATCRVGQGVSRRRGTYGMTPCPSVESPSSSFGDFCRGRDRQIEGDGRHHGRGAKRSSPAGQCEEASHNTDQGGVQASRVYSSVRRGDGGVDGGAPCGHPHSHGCRTAPRGGQNFSVDDPCGARAAPVDPWTDELSISGGEHSEVIGHQCGGAHGALSGACERNFRYGLRGVKIGEALNPGPSKRSTGRDTVVHARQRSEVSDPRHDSDRFFG